MFAPTTTPQQQLGSPSSSSRPRVGDSSSPSSRQRIVRLTSEELEQVMENFAHEDTEYGKTMTRIVVERFLMNWSWYFPRKGMKNAPSLSKAYTYYEHVTLPRHFVGEQQADHVLRRAEPGEAQQSTELYSPIKTPSSSFIEWGIGVDLYFSTLRIMALVLFLAGIIHLPNQIFYQSSDYSAKGKADLPWSLRGSAICTTTSWVACQDCDPNRWQDVDEIERFVFGTNATGQEVALVQQNDCDMAQLQQGLLNYAVLFFLVIVFFLLSMYLGAREIRFDEDKVTSTDYTVIVKNPPKDAYDPDEWRDFFAQFAEKQVTCVTIALNNEVLLQKLIARRIHRNNLRLMLPKGIDMDNEDAVRSAVAKLVRDRDLEPRGCLWKLFDCTVLKILNLFNMLLPAETLVDRVFKLTDEIKELQTAKYDVCRVFVTFETEEGQRAALSALSIGRVDIMMNNKQKVGALFRDHILRVGEPTEPSAVRWLDLSASPFRRTFMRVLNLAVTIFMVAFAGYLVGRVRFDIGAFAAAPLITVFNSIIPMIVKILMIFEPHSTEGGYQAALYMKITLFRWVNTALQVKLITPWASTLAEGSRSVVAQINAILWSELWITPLLRLLDLWGNIQKHILAPRARTQEQMNLNFQGTRYNLGERYTDLTKVLFICFFYCVLYPAAFFFGAAILIVQYYVDKFCLMRIWSYSPSIGSEVARFSRTYFFSAAVLAYCVISAYMWAGFPYDNLCDPESPTYGASQNYTNIRFAKETDAIPPLSITVLQDTYVRYCQQRFSGFDGFLFPPVPSKQPKGLTWMNESQESLTLLYGWTSCFFLIGFIVLFFGNAIKNYVKSWVMGVYEPRGQKQNIDFSANNEIFAYIPQIKIGGFPFPCLACDIDQIDQNLIGWNDRSMSYDYHNLIFDVEWKGMPRRRLIEGNTRNTASISDQDAYQGNSERNPIDGINRNPIELTKPIFSIVKHYPPEWTKKLK